MPGDVAGRALPDRYAGGAAMKSALEALAERVAALEERAEKHAEALERVCGILEKTTGVKPSAPQPERKYHICPKCQTGYYGDDRHACAERPQQEPSLYNIDGRTYIELTPAVRARVEAKEVREHMYANDHWVACDYSLCQKPHRTIYVPKEKP
jgi:hypothetical protein